jgi:glycine cleavage system H protein
MDPAKLLYTKTHEWVSFDADVATVGITEFAANQLTDLSYIELPPVGRQVAVGEDCGVIETVKAASDLYAPCAGEIVETNSALEDDYELLTNSPLGDGWVMKIRVADPDEAAGGLLQPAEYEQLCESESH